MSNARFWIPNFGGVCAALMLDNAALAQPNRALPKRLAQNSEPETGK